MIKKNIISMAVCMMTPAMLLSAQSAYAEAIDLGELQLDTDYQLENFKAYVGTFTPEQSGVMIMSGGESAWYTDAEATNMLDGESGGYVEGKPTYLYNVEGGHTYYFNAPFVMSNTVMRLSMGGDAKLLSISPEEGSVYSPSGYPYCDIAFSEPVTISGARISAGDKSKSVKVLTGNATLSVQLKEPVLSWLVDGTLSEGDEFTITIEGIKSKTGNLYNDNGLLNVTYKSSAKPAMLKSNTFPTTFNSYYAEGDPDGIFTLTFDTDMWAEGGKAVLGYGSKEGEDSEYYQEEVPYTVNGKVVTVDMTGKRRTPQDMLPSGNSYDSILMSFPQMKDASGNLAFSEGSGSLGSFFFPMTYNEIKKAQIFADFTPVNGSTLKGVDNISVWISGLDNITFDGFNIAYSDGGEVKNTVVELASCKADGKGNEVEYTFAVPEVVKGKKNVVVTLAGLKSNDGYDHTDDVKAAYDAFVLTYVDPANGTKMEVLKEGTVITVKTNVTEEYPEMYMIYEIEDMNPTNPEQAIVKSESWLTRQEDGSYTAEVWGDYKLLAGHSYRVTFTAWANEEAKNYGQEPVGTAYVTWEGLSKPYVYSSITMQEVSPVPGSMLTPENNVITFLFDGMVTIDKEYTFINLGMGATRDFDGIEAVKGIDEGGMQYSNEWKFTISPEYVAAQTADIYVSFQFKDMDGLVVDAGDEAEENSTFMYTYDVEGKYLDYNVTPASESTLETLSEITLSSINGEVLSLSYTTDSPVVMNMLGGVVANVAEVEPVKNDEEKVTSLRLVLDKEVTASGAYIVNIPAGYMLIENNVEAMPSIEKFITYYIENGSKPSEMNVVADPAAGEVDELSQVLLTFTDYESVGGGSGKATLTKDGGEAENLPDAQYAVEMNQMVQPIGRTIKEDGSYTISFPAGYFGLGDDGDPSSAFELKYIISQTGVTSIAADANGRYEVYDASGIRVLSTANAEDLKSLPRGFYIINGVKTVLVK